MDDEERPKLLQSRMYLKAARWGFDQLLRDKPVGYQFRFYMIGILSSLRAVQHALYSHDRGLSGLHRKIIDEWWNDPKTIDAPELKFIRTARDLILKEGSFDSYATHSQSGTGEGDNYIVTSEDYDLAWYFDQERRDLRNEITRAIDWCEHALGSIESNLPTSE